MPNAWLRYQAHSIGGLAASWMLKVSDTSQSDRMRDNAVAWAVEAAQLAGHFGRLAFENIDV